MIFSLPNDFIKLGISIAVLKGVDLLYLGDDFAKPAYFLACSIDKISIMAS